MLGVECWVLSVECCLCLVLGVRALNSKVITVFMAAGASIEVVSNTQQRVSLCLATFLVDVLGIMFALCLTRELWSLTSTQFFLRLVQLFWHLSARTPSVQTHV